MKLTHDTDTVKDCIQNLFLKLWKNRANLQPVREIKPYLFKSMRNHLLDIMELRKPVPTPDGDLEELFSPEYSAEDFLISGQQESEKQETVIHLLNSLSPRQRHAVYLRYFENLDFETIARVMDMQVQSVRNTISRGLQDMRKDH